MVEMERTGMFENGLLEDQIDVTAAVDGEELRFGYQSSYDSGDQTWQISMDLGMADEAEAFLLKAEGEVEDLEKGSGISVVMDDLTLSFDGAQVNLEGSYSYGPLEESIESLEGDPLNVFTATEADWTAVGEEISKKFQSLQFTVIMQTGL